MFFGKIFLSYLIALLLTSFLNGSILTNSTLQSVEQEPALHLLENAQKVMKDNSCTTPDGKLKVTLSKTALTQKSGENNLYIISIVCAPSQKVLLLEELEEPQTPKLYVTKNSKVVIQRGAKFNIFDEIEK